MPRSRKGKECDGLCVGERRTPRSAQNRCNKRMKRNLTINRVGCALLKLSRNTSMFAL